MIESHAIGRSTDTPGASYTQQTGNNLPGQTVKTIYDKFGRKYKTEQHNAMLGKLYTFTEYYPDGKVYRTSRPGNLNCVWDVTYTYDKYGRIASTKTLEDSTIVTYGSTNKVAASNYMEKRSTSGRVVRTNWNTYGQMIKTTTDGKSVQFTYSAGNRLKTTTPDGGGSIQMEYNLQGNRTKLIDPDAGTITYNYNGRGQLRSEQRKIHSSAQSVNTSYAYKPTGLLDRKTVLNMSTGALVTTRYEYDTKNRLIKTYLDGDSHTCTYEYDNFDRMIRSTEVIKGKSLVTNWVYDTSGRITKQTFPTGYAITNSYSYGYLMKVTDNASRVVWQLTGVDEEGKVAKEKKNGVETTFVYDPSTNQIASIKATGIVDMNYTYYSPYTAKSGNLKMYRDGISNQQETYTYDNMDRLVNWKTPTDYYPNYKAEYTSSGNRITFKYDWLDYGNIYGYKSSTSNQIDYIDYTGAPRPGGGFTHSAVQEINYTDFNKVKSMAMDGDQSCNIEYGVGQQRVYMKLNRGRYYSERYYAGDYEEDYDAEAGVSSKIHYLYGSNGLAGMYIIKGTTGTLYSTYFDRQGSLVALANGSTVAQSYAYDPWGKRRNPVNWLEKDTRSSYGFNALLSYRGYCMHEHLDTYGLINMNARMYDPLTGTFISPDPQLQAPENWLNYNRYAYCLNNPLKYTDPTGEWFGIDDLLIAGTGFLSGYLGHGFSTGNWGLEAVAAGGIGAATAWLGYNISGMSSGEITGDTWKHVGNMGINAVANQIMPSLNIPMGNFGISLSPAFGLGQSGLTGGVNMSAWYSDGDVSFGASIGAGMNYWGWNVSATYEGWGFGVGQTSYGDSEFMGHPLGAQRLGTLTGYFNHNSLVISNDNFGDKGDRWRTSAVELTIGKWSLGTYIYTNDGQKESKEKYNNTKAGVPDWPVGNKRNSYNQTWADGRPYFAPAWIGHRDGNKITRIGFSHKIIHNITQNMMHKYLNTPYYMNYENFRTGGYFYTGYRNPLSLYDY